MKIQRKFFDYESARTLKSEGAFRRAYDRNQKDHSAVNDAMIAAGHGHWKNAETAAAAKQGDPLAVLSEKLSDESRALGYHADSFFGRPPYLVHGKVRMTRKRNPLGRYWSGKMGTYPHAKSRTITIQEAARLIRDTEHPALAEQFLKQPANRHTMVTALHKTLSKKSNVFAPLADEIAVMLRAAIDADKPTANPRKRTKRKSNPLACVIALYMDSGKRLTYDDTRKRFTDNTPPSLYRTSIAAKNRADDILARHPHLRDYKITVETATAKERGPVYGARPVRNPKALANIEKSAFRKGQYVGYAGGVWNITKTNSSYGNWIAHFRDDPKVPPIYAFTLEEMSGKLTDPKK